ncbi:Kinesin-4 [Platanthera guangdongensis]|uniref:Kinesin-4 n=1 Tax=Platanthera guangdongensis TaxID=2320717 RepID=A0ABR2MRH7_9ASPA
MALTEGFFSLSVVSVLEDVLKEQGKRLSDMDFASRKVEEDAARRYAASGWLRRTLELGANDFPEEPTEEEFRIGLRSGFILCTALNKVHPGAVPKIVANSSDSMIVPDAAALLAYQYFENVRNFLVAIEEIGLPAFETSDFEQGGKSSRIVNCILALKSYSEWKKMGGTGSWKFGANVRPTSSGNFFTRKNSNLFSNSFTRTRVNSCAEQNIMVESQETNSHSFSNLVHAVLLDKQPEDVPKIVESMLNKVVEEFERRIESQNEVVKTALRGLHGDSKSFSKLKVLSNPANATCEMKEKSEDIKVTMSKEENFHRNAENEEASKDKFLKQCLIIDQQQRHIQDLKLSLQTTKAGMEVMQTKCSLEIQLFGKHMSNLANAASGYHKVLEENRKLYNQVQDLRGSIRVYCRVRPNISGKSNISTIGYFHEGNITVNTKFGKEGRRNFTFNKVFGPSASQEEVFSDTRPLIRSILDGYNVCIFAYGQTGSGKTYTMNGPQELNQHNMGVNYRALRDLFNLAGQRRGTFTYDISVQMIEIYNEQVRDLLIGDGANRRLDIRNVSQNGVNVPDANLFPVSSMEDVIELMNIGQMNRVVGATALNDRSSRSHSCLTIHVQGKDFTSQTILRGCMHLVDLAGSERVDKSEVTGERLREAQHINKSLSALGDVISALAQKSSHIPYRNSKLTQLLQDSLGGQAKTLMFVHISPEMDAVGETISTLKFAERVSTIELGAARLNKESVEATEHKEKIASLKAASLTRGEDSDHLQSMTPTLSASKVKLRSPSPAYSSRKYKENVLSYQSSSHTQPMEEVHNVEITPASRKKTLSFDLQELLMVEEDSHPWPDSSPVLKPSEKNDKETSSGNWVDKVVVNTDWVEDEAAMPDFFYQRSVSDTRVFQVQQYRTHLDPATTDDSDDFDVGTSDSSEADALWQINAPKATHTISKDGSKIKKPLIKSMHHSDSRAPIQAQIPSPSRKISTGTGRTMLTYSSFGKSDGKRASSVGKMRGGK